MAMGEYSVCAGACFLLISVVLCIVIPISFSYLEYYEYGLVQRRSTSRVDIDKVYHTGRYFIGPDFKFLKYPADMHFVHIEEMAVFSSSRGSNESIGLEFELDVDFTYQIIKEEVGLLHKELATSYKNVVLSRAKDAMKNDAIFITFQEFFQDRKGVEQRLREAVEKRLDIPPKTHVNIDQFHLGRIGIPEAVRKIQLEGVLQNERNGMETYKQEAEVQRQKTTVDVNQINLKKDKVLATAQAQANLIRAKAVTRSKEITNQAQLNGTKMLVDVTEIRTQDHKTAFTYLRTLMNRRDVNIDVSYLSSDSIIKIRES